jgi:hypothetical protein
MDPPMDQVLQGMSRRGLCLTIVMEGNAEDYIASLGGIRGWLSQAGCRELVGCYRLLL